MIKQLLSLAAVATMAFSANAETKTTVLWENAEPVTIEWGKENCKISAAVCEEFKAGDILGVTVTETTDADKYPQFIICGSTEDWEWIEISGSIGLWDDKTFPVVKDYEITAEFIEKAKVHGIFIKGTAVKISKVTLTTEVGPQVPVTEKQLSIDGANLLLNQFVDLADDTEIVVTLSISNKDSNVAAGWGVGSIHPISNYNKSLYDFKAKAVSEEGADNTYKFTAGQFKAWAKEGAEEGKEYYTDEWGQQGLTFNTYNGASIKSIVAKIKDGTTGIEDITIEDANAPVEYFNLQGIRVNNPENGIFIRRQGKNVTKVIVK